MDIPKQRAIQRQTQADENELDALGGEPLAGSGFEGEEPEPGFGDIETSGPAPGQSPG